jgi:hypothetical protein
MPSLLYDACDTTIVFVCGDASLDDGEWGEYLEFLKEEFGSGRRNRSLVWAPTAQPNSIQRGRLNVVLEELKVRGIAVKSAVITNSALVRGVITALQWFNRDVFRTFAPADVQSALKFLGLESYRAMEAEDTLRRLEKRLALESQSDRAKAG